jgi:hypothetical protein
LSSDSAAGQVEALPAQSTAILDRSSPSVALPDLPAQSTAILDGSGPKVIPSPKTTSNASTMMREAPADLPSIVLGPQTPPASIPVGVVVPVPVNGQAVAPLPVQPPAPPRSTLWKDVLIGVGVAAAVVVGVLGGRAWFRGTARGTLVVMVSPARAADLLVDGKARGHLQPGVPLTLKDLPAGAHEVVVHAGEARFRQAVTLAAGDVSVITASLQEAPPSVGTGTLTLKLPAEADDAQVYVDGALLAGAKGKIPLRADVAHEIRVTKPATKEVHLAVTLKAGEDAAREIVLEPSVGKINVVTDPAGAEVNVNGKRAGVTPATVGDVDTAKPARLTVRHKGYAPITKYVNFDKGLEQTFEIKMIASADDGFGGAAPEPAEPIKSQKTTPVVAAAAAKDKPKPMLLTDPDDLTPGTPHPIKEKSEGPKPLVDDKAAKDKAASDPGFLVANTQPWAKVLIDGKDTGKTTPIAPRSKIPLKPGKHVVTFVANGKKFNFDVLIKPAEDTRLIKQLTDSAP